MNITASYSFAPIEFPIALNQDPAAPASESKANGDNQTKITRLKATQAILFGTAVICGLGAIIAAFLLCPVPASAVSVAAILGIGGSLAAGALSVTWAVALIHALNKKIEALLGSKPEAPQEIATQ